MGNRNDRTPTPGADETATGATGSLKKRYYAFFFTT
jgi:hypothetical protein